MTWIVLEETWSKEWSEYLRDLATVYDMDSAEWADLNQYLGKMYRNGFFDQFSQKSRKVLMEWFAEGWAARAELEKSMRLHREQNPS